MRVHEATALLDGADGQQLAMPWRPAFASAPPSIGGQQHQLTAA
jgi:hypothetical protein